MSLTKVLPEMITDLGAITGIIETNSNFVDFQVFGPARDPVKDWHKRLGASVATELMLVTVEDTGTDTDVTIWDLTDVSLVGGTPLATVTLTGAATVTSVKAAMGYIIVGSEDGISIIDPHDGAWAERTEGWPKSLTASTVPALGKVDVAHVAAGFSDTPRYDPRTKGPMPSFMAGHASGTPNASLIKDDGNVWDSDATQVNEGVAIANGRPIMSRGGGTDNVIGSVPISRIVSDATFVSQDNIIASATISGGLYADTGLDYDNGLLAGAAVAGLSMSWGVGFTDILSELNAHITRAFNIGWEFGDVRGTWLANSKTVDRSYKNNTLTENGTVPTASVESGAELTAYGPFTSTNNFSRALDADFQITTGVVCMMGWFKSSGTSTTEVLCSWSSTNSNQDRYKVRITNAGLVDAQFRASASTRTPVSTAAYDDGAWHMFVAIGSDNTTHDPTGTNFCFLYVNGELVGTAVGPGTDFTSDAGATWTIGIDGDGTDDEALTTQLALVRLTNTEPTVAQIRHMYETERRMFESNAKCLLQSGSTDAVLDVQIDPITNKVSVTQTDDEVTFDGLVIADEPIIPSGGSNWEHVARYGDDRFVITDANLYVDLAAKNLRQEFEAVRGNTLKKGPDLGRAKVLLVFQGATPPQIKSSMNVKSVIRNGTGDYTINFEVPFKSANGMFAVFNSAQNSTSTFQDTCGSGSITTTSVKALMRRSSSGTITVTDQRVTLAIYGELENE